MKDVANYSQSNINTIKNVVPFLLKNTFVTFWTVLIYTAAVTNCHTF